MTNTNTTPALTETKTAMLTLADQIAYGIIADHQNLTPEVCGENGTVYGRGEYLEMRLGNRTVYLVHIEGEGERAVLMNARRSLMMNVWLTPEGYFEITDVAKRNKTFGKGEYLPVAELGAAAECNGRLPHVSHDHKGSAALRQFAINNEPELRFAIQALAILN